MCLKYFLISDFGMGSAKHEDLPAGRGVFPQSGGGVWGSESGISCHQKHEEEPQFPQLCPLHQSGIIIFSLNPITY